MKIPFVDLDHPETFKTNLPAVEDRFKEKDNKWLKEVFGDQFFKHMKKEVPDIELDLSKEKPSDTDFENVRRIYPKLSISDSNASDERIWAGLALGPFYDYVKYRWPSSLGTDDDSSVKPAAVKEKYTFNQQASKRALMRNAISRLWWIGRLTYDPNRSDPYELTKFVCKNQNFIVSILDRNFSNNPKILHEFLQALIDAETEGYSIGKAEVEKLAKYLNELGGAYVLDILPEGTIHKKILKKIHSEFVPRKTDGLDSES